MANGTKAGREALQLRGDDVKKDFNLRNRKGLNSSQNIPQLNFASIEWHFEKAAGQTAVVRVAPRLCHWTQQHYLSAHRAPARHMLCSSIHISNDVAPN